MIKTYEFMNCSWIDWLNNQADSTIVATEKRLCWARLYTGVLWRIRVGSPKQLSLGQEGHKGFYIHLHVRYDLTIDIHD